MVFITENEASLHAVNLAVALARPDIDSIHVMHACSNDGATPDAQKLMARLTQGLGPKVNSEVMVSHHMYFITCCTEPCCIMHPKHVCGLVNRINEHGVMHQRRLHENEVGVRRCLLMHSSQSILVIPSPC